MSAGRYGGRPTGAGRAGTPGAWADEAACKGRTKVMFPANDDHALAAAALRICETCPVVVPCLEFALATRQDDGIWGGRTTYQRRELRRRRRLAVSA